MDNVLCKIGLHKWHRVKSTKTTVMKVMENILNDRNELTPRLNGEERICKMFGVNRNTLLIGCEICDRVCMRCGTCEYFIDEKREELIEKRNKIVEKEINNKNKDKLIENIYKGCKNGS